MSSSTQENTKMLTLAEYPTYTSSIFDREFSVNELDDLDVEDLVILQDEVNIDLKDVVKKYKNLSKKDKIEGTSSVIQDYKKVKIFQAAIKRVVYFKSKSMNCCLRKCKEEWKKRALILGERLGMNKEEVKQLTVV